MAVKRKGGRRFAAGEGPADQKAEKGRGETAADAAKDASAKLKGKAPIAPKGKFGKR